SDVAIERPPCNVARDKVRHQQRRRCIKWFCRSERVQVTLVERAARGHAELIGARATDGEHGRCWLDRGELPSRVGLGQIEELLTGACTHTKDACVVW